MEAGVAELAVRRIVEVPEQAGLLTHERVGRRRASHVDRHKRSQHPLEQQLEVETFAWGIPLSEHIGDSG